MNVNDVKLVSACLALAKPAIQRTAKRLSKGKMPSATAGVALTAIVVGGLAVRQVLKKSASDSTTPSESQTDQNDAKVYHLESADDAWKITLEGKGEVRSDFPTKADALEVARELARENQPSELVINSLDGSEQARHVYGVN